MPLSSLPTYASSSKERLKSLYSDFTHQKQSNPTSYASNVEWWRRTLEDALLKGLLPQSPAPDKLVLHATGVAFADGFRYEGVGKPLSIPTAIAELCNSKAYIAVPDFLSSSRSIYDPGWLPYRIAAFAVGKPLWWALGQLGVVDTHANVFGDSSTAERWKKVKGDYVVVALLESAAERVVERQQARSGGSLADALYTPESFREEFAACAFEGAVLSELDVKILLRYLERDKRVLVVRDEVIKFVDTPGDPAAEITTVDRGILALKSAVDKLHAQVDGIQRRIDEQTSQISSSLRAKRKEMALTHLRVRKQLEDLLKKRLGALDNLQATLLRVEASAGDIEIMKSYESSAATLRAILAHPLLQREKVDETMEALASANADAREVDETIRIGADIAHGDAGVDDSELEVEFQALLREAEKEKEAEMAERLAAGELRTPAHSPGEEARERSGDQEKVAVAA